MKKFLLFVLILLVLDISVWVLFPFYFIKSFNSYKKFDFTKTGDLPANKILYIHSLIDLKMTPKQAKEYADLTLDSVCGYFADLNDDGIDEIIGIINSTYYLGSAGHSLFILRKRQQNYYEDITYILNFAISKDFVILKSKTNGYYDILLYDSHGKPFIIKYKDNAYQNDYQLKILEDTLRK